MPRRMAAGRAVSVAACQLLPFMVTQLTGKSMDLAIIGLKLGNN